MMVGLFTNLFFSLTTWSYILSVFYINKTPEEFCSSYSGNPFNLFGVNRIQWPEPKTEVEWPTDCQSICQRSNFQTNDLYPEEAGFPIAIARAVFMDYHFIELDLGAMYSPHNFYCYALDSKSSPLFHQRMRSLANCFPNVFLTDHELPMDSDGHNMNSAHYQCMLKLADYKWKYLVLLQNHDVPLKTNQELIQIFKWFNGTNDVAAAKVDDNRINPKANWTFAAMNLFKNQSRNFLLHHGYPPILPLTKSMVFVSLSREMVDFLINEINLPNVINNFEWKAYGVDEQLIGSLNAADAVDVPGGYTRHCYEKGSYSLQITKFMLDFDMFCSHDLKRHYVCVIGLEHLGILQHRPELFANKMMPNVDYNAIRCWYEELRRRTHLDRGLHQLHSSVYLNLPHVRFNRERRSENFTLTDFTCESNTRIVSWTSWLLFLLCFRVNEVD
ncbi:Beta-1,3-galactosyl-O-glycosyl-glycoprotein beta-1,6-N-acetylglucosaminyltransferase 3 [Aphelenchoides besseyi]|nr:Beta-1,3-galactosyl-O-glycosyl-glycoprotein beta-1,6-N-acetylglucosaminyltransferase 3 [Aphelenchoides besseyi]